MTFLSCISIHGVGKSFLMQSNASVYQNHNGHQRCPRLQSVISSFFAACVASDHGIAAFVHDSIHCICHYRYRGNLALLQKLFNPQSMPQRTAGRESVCPLSLSASSLFYEYCFCSRITAGFDIGLPVANHIA